MDAISAARLAEVHPMLAEKIRAMISQLEIEGIETRVTQARRSWSQQDSLFAQGRTAPGKIVTNVKGGYSYHNFGLAVDCVPSQFAPDKPYNPDWNSKHPSWIRMEALGISMGLDSGSQWRTFPDAPHFQLTGSFAENEPPEEVRELFKEGGYEAVWKAVTIIST